MMLLNVDFGMLLLNPASSVSMIKEVEGQPGPVGEATRKETLLKNNGLNSYIRPGTA